MASYKKEFASEITEFFGLVDHPKDDDESQGNSSDILFRGQKSDEPLLPKLARL